MKKNSASKKKSASALGWWSRVICSSISLLIGYYNCGAFRQVLSNVISLVLFHLLCGIQANYKEPASLRKLAINGVSMPMPILEALKGIYLLYSDQLRSKDPLSYSRRTRITCAAVCTEPLTCGCSSLRRTMKFARHRHRYAPPEAPLIPS